MQDRYRPIPQDAAEFRTRRSGWEAVLESPVPPEIDTPEKRLSALVNIVQNGAQTLEVLSMSSDFQTYGIIHADMTRRVGFRVINSATTYDHLLSCIEPVGAAARSTLDDKEWVLTEFGEAAKPALVFAWQRLLSLNLDAMQVFATTTRGKRDKDKHLITTPALVRTQILTVLTSKEIYELVELKDLLGLSHQSIERHTANLKSAGLVDKESADTESGQSIGIFIVSDEGSKTLDWSIARDINKEQLSSELLRACLRSPIHRQFLTV